MTRFDVFISHSSKDKKAADAVCAVLEQHGLRCWVAPRDIPPGVEWGAGILAGIASCGVMVLVFSHHANESPQVRREVERAVNKGLTIIPFRIEDVLPTESLEYFISAAHWLDSFTPPLQRHLKHLAETILHMLGRDTGELAPTPPPPGPPLKGRKSSRRRAVVIAAVAVVTSLVFGGLSWFNSHRKSTQPEKMVRDEKIARQEPPNAAAATPTSTTPSTALASAAPPKPTEDIQSTPPPKILSKTTTAPAAATKDTPFENSLGMKFVPVPGTDVLFGIHEVRYKDYEEYAKKAKETVDGAWKTFTEDGFEIKKDAGDHPVTKVNWDDAQKFCAWLSEKEGKTYRLPTDREWSHAVGIGREEDWKSDTTPETVFKVPDDFPWGDEWPPPAAAGNYSDASRQAKAPLDDAKYVEGGYDDGFPTTAPVMSFEANKLGLYDLGGNVWEWCNDWYSVEQNDRVLRGGSWNRNERGTLLSSGRYRNTPDFRINTYGFRVVVAVSSGG